MYTRSCQAFFKWLFRAVNNISLKTAIESRSLSVFWSINTIQGFTYILLGISCSEILYVSILSYFAWWWSYCVCGSFGCPKDKTLATRRTFSKKILAWLGKSVTLTLLVKFKYIWYYCFERVVHLFNACLTLILFRERSSIMSTWFSCKCIEITCV